VSIRMDNGGEDGLRRKCVHKDGQWWRRWAPKNDGAGKKTFVG
jgi:hypothetical protein